MSLFDFLFSKLLLALFSVGISISSWVVPMPPPISTPPLVVASTTTPAVQKPMAPVPTQTVPKPNVPTSPPPARDVPSTPTPPAVPAQTPGSQEPTSSTTASGDINTKTREALVNILCTTPAGGPLKPLSGSGVIIDPRGVIMTNAHVAQFFLLRDYPTPGTIDCVIRSGSPARTMYRAELLFFPTSWMERNAIKIRQDSPTGTGEDDFALLYITGRTDPTAALPTSFPYISYRLDDDFSLGDPLLIAAYPAGFLGGATVQTNLFISSALSDIKKVYTYESGSVDLISVGGTIVSQQGSSGGAAVTTSDQKLVGIIVTSTLAAQTADRDLRAITLYHVNERVKKNAGVGLEALLSGDIAAYSRAFNVTTAPTLKNALVTELER